jgi:hypothetical protein
VFRRNDAAISALTEFLDELVLRVDNKSRVQSIETVSLHDDDGDDDDIVTVPPVDGRVRKTSGSSTGW